MLIFVLPSTIQLICYIERSMYPRTVIALSYLWKRLMEINDTYRDAFQHLARRLRGEMKQQPFDPL